MPCQRPSWAQLIAVDTNTGTIVWKAPLGLNEDLPAGRQNVGGSGSAGPMTTASGLVFIGATNDRRFRAFDAKTGNELWATQLGQAVNANPMCCRGRNGKQYIAVVANSQLVTFTLP